MSTRAPTAMDRAELSPIAITGIGCRYPGGIEDSAGFWRLLQDGRDAIKELPAGRFSLDYYGPSSLSSNGRSTTIKGGFLEQRLDLFDSSFFGIAPREAACIDPQQRMLLEVAWEALEDAGQTAETVAGTRTGVFVGIWTSDYETRIARELPISALDLYTVLGSARYSAAGRVSFAFDLRGPSFSVDTACSSSLVSVHLACESIWNGEATMALAAGVNLIMEPHIWVGGLGSFLSPDFRCKFGDASGNGYVRAEGIGVVVLKPLAQALADNDPIYAVIRGSSVNNDGRSSGLLQAPAVETQTAVLRQAYSRAGVDPALVDYVEAHGTGTAVGDPVELKALGAVLGPGRPAGQDCLIGSVKTNFGHTEAAAGVAGLIKAALCLKHREIPASLHLNEPNPNIPWSDLPFEMVGERRPWPETTGPALVGVNSFGITGTNAHVVLQEAPSPAISAAPQADEDYLIPISARTRGALQGLARSYVEHARQSGDSWNLRDVAYTAARRRTHHEHRAAVVARNREEFAEQLEALLNGEERQGIASGRANPAGYPGPVFVFSGMGPQWWAMGRELLATEPVFREAVEECDALFRPLAGWSLIEELTAPEAESRMRRIDVAQSTSFALQVGLVALWRAWGVVPAAVAGHSTGEVAAAYVSGILSLPDAVKVIYHRSRLQQTTAGLGKMVAVELDPDAVAPMLQQFKGQVSIAAINSPNSVTLAGEGDAIDEIAELLTARDVFVRFLRVETAYHSPLMDPLQDELVAELDGLVCRPASISAYTTVTGALADAQAYGTGYWWHNVRQPVYFARAMNSAIADGYRTFLEIGAHPVLAGSMADCLRTAGTTGKVLSSLRRAAPERAYMLASLAALYADGYPVDWSSLYPVGHCVSLPRYAWQHESIWFGEDPQIDPQQHMTGRRRRHTGRALAHGTHPFLGVHTECAVPGGSHLWEVELDPMRFPYLKDHRVGQMVVFPAAGYLDIILAVAREMWESGAIALEGVSLHEALILSGNAPRLGQVVVTPDGSGATNFQFFSRSSAGSGEWTLHVSGKLALHTAATDARQESLEHLRTGFEEGVSPDEHYGRARERQLEYGPSFQAVRGLWQRADEALGQIALNAELQGTLSSYQLHPVLLDAAFQVLLSALEGSMIPISSDALCLPVGLDRLHFYQVPDGPDLWVHARFHAASEGPSLLQGDIDLVDERGRLIATIEGLSLQVIERPIEDRIRDWLYEVEWQPRSVETPLAPRGGRWLLFSAADETSRRLQALLTASGAECEVVTAGDMRSWSPGRYSLDPSDAAAYRDLLKTIIEVDDAPIEGIVHLWGLSDKADPASLAAQEQGSISVLHLVQALAESDERVQAPLWVVTRGVQPLHLDGHLPAIAQAPVWGLGRVIAQELPELQCRLVDLSSAGGAEEVHQLFQELWTDGSESEVALRGPDRYVARLVRAALHAAGTTDDRSIPVRPDATYLITGGLGGLGLAMAQSLAARGARHLALLGRTVRAEAPETVQQMRAAGVEVRIISCDVADPGQVTNVMEQLACNLPPLRGIIHAAGVLDDAILLQQSRERFERVMAPKIRGAWNLHTHTAGTELDFFVLFSSAAALIGLPGQGNYVAANAFLDALAHYRRAQGLPALSINWGAWSEVGMATEMSRGERLESQGVSSINPRHGTEAFWAVLGHSRPQIGVMPFDCGRWCAMQPAAASWPLLSDLIAEFRESAEASGEGDRVDALREALRRATPHERRSLLESAICEQVAQVVKIAPSRIDQNMPMKSLGFDSLMSLELRARLERVFGIALAPTIAFNYPTISALAPHIAEKLDLPLEVDEPVLPPALAAIEEELQGVLRGIDDLSTEELQQLLIDGIA